MQSIERINFRMHGDKCPLCVEVSYDQPDPSVGCEGRFDVVSASVMPFDVDITDALSAEELEEIKKQVFDAFDD